MSKKLALILVTLGAICCAPAVQAGPHTDALSRCLGNSTTGKDRTDLARWIYTQMALHPEIQDMAAISADKRLAINKTAGALYSRLMVDACATELKAAIQNEGEGAIKAGFQFLGGLAMQELMSNPGVAAGFGDFEKYVDRERILEVMRTR